MTKAPIKNHAANHKGGTPPDATNGDHDPGQYSNITTAKELNRINRQ